METYLEKLPFLTVIKYLDVEYVGIIGDSDNQTTSFYPFLDEMSEQLKKLYLELSLFWWWETNRKLPISVALFKQWKIFNNFTLNFITKDLEYIAGREFFSLEKTFIKKTKRKQLNIKK